MMSFYTVNQGVNQPQIPLRDNKTALQYLPQCHDNSSFSPDIPISSSTAMSTTTTIPTLSSSTSHSTRTTTIDKTFCHLRNKTFPSIGNPSTVITTNQQQSTKISKTTTATTTTSIDARQLNTTLSNNSRRLLYDDDGGGIKSRSNNDDGFYYHNNSHNQSNNDYNNKTTFDVLSQGDVNTTIEDNLPVIMQHLCIDSCNKTASQPMMNESITRKLPSSKQQQQQEQNITGGIIVHEKNIDYKNNFTNTSRNSAYNIGGKTLQDTIGFQYSKMPPATNITFYDNTTATARRELSLNTVVKNSTRDSAQSTNHHDFPTTEYNVIGQTEEQSVVQNRSNRFHSSSVDDPADDCNDFYQQHENDQFHFDFPTDMFSSSNFTKKKRFGRLKRSATNDESMFKSSIIQPQPLPRCKSIDCSTGLNDAEHDYFARKPRKTTSKRKMLRRSVSLGFSKFKLISNFNMRSHQRLPENDITIDINETEYQTSRRKNTNSTETQAAVEKILNSESVEGICPSKYPPLLRSLSAPETLEQQGDIYDEDISELHLPRRRAICPNLPVPAMKQLKTYLILTRLKQYCFV